MTPQALSLDALIANGVTIAGLPAIRAVFTMPDGREVALDLPGPAPDPSSLTPMQAAVVQAIDEMKPGEVLSFEEIAEKAGYSNGESLRQFVRTVAEMGRLEKVHRGWKRK